MADINNIRIIAKKLGLSHIACGDVDVSNEAVSNTDYLETVLKSELNMRLSSRATRLKSRSKLPHKSFDGTVLSDGLKWQFSQLETMNWVEDSENLLIVGKCGVGKTGLAVRLGEKQSKTIIKPTMLRLKPLYPL